MAWLAADHPALDGVPPMPADFAPALRRGPHRPKGPNAVWWRGTVNGVQYEVGFPASDPLAAEKTTLAVWHVQQLALLGRHEVLAAARPDRHARRPGPKAPAPQLAPAAPREV
jgi:hypothetical protein